MSYDDDIRFEGATVESVGMNTTSTGKPQLVIVFNTNDEPRFVKAYRYFTEAALQYTEKDLRTLGWDPTVNAWNIDALIADEPIRGNVVDLVCAWESYEKKDGTTGKTLKVKFINSPGGAGGQEQMAPDKVRAFTTQLRQRLGVTGGAAKRPAPKPADVAVADDDIPF